jgi:hypothetical protein
MNTLLGTLMSFREFPYEFPALPLLVSFPTALVVLAPLKELYEPLAVETPGLEFGTDKEGETPGLEVTTDNEGREEESIVDTLPRLFKFWRRNPPATWGRTA